MDKREDMRREKILTKHSKTITVFFWCFIVHMKNKHLNIFFLHIL
jgi:hypothetical protein